MPNADTEHETQNKHHRELSPAELGLMNEIKQQGAALNAITLKVHEHLAQQQVEAASDDTTFARIADAQPGRWLAIGTTQLQEGLMALNRAVAQPTFF